LASAVPALGLSGLREVARQIRQFRGLRPPFVEAVRVHGDGEFFGWESVQACRAEGFEFTFGNKRCAPDFPGRRPGV